MKPVQFNIIRALISTPRDYTIEEAGFIIQQYVLYRTGKEVKITGGSTLLFEKAVTYAENYFKATYGKLWH